MEKDFKDQSQNEILLTEEKLTIDKGGIGANYRELNCQLEILRDKLIKYLKL